MRCILILLAGLGAAACAPIGESSLPIATELLPSAQPSAARTLVIVLPGRADDGLGENERGMASAIHEAWPGADVLLTSEPGPLPAEVDARNYQRQVWKHIREQSALASRVWLACGSDDYLRTWSRIGRTVFSQIRTLEPDTL